MSARFRLQYTRSNDTDTEFDVDITFENVDHLQLAKNINTWLKTIDMPLEVKQLQVKVLKSTETEL
jgi:hypothetical protein